MPVGLIINGRKAIELFREEPEASFEAIEGYKEVTVLIDLQDSDAFAHTKLLTSLIAGCALLDAKEHVTDTELNFTTLTQSTGQKN